MREPGGGPERVSAVTPGTGDLDEFYVAVYPRLVGLVTAMAGGSEDAEAIVQDAFVALIPRWSRIARYDDPEAWVRQVAVRTLVSRHRHSRVAARFLPRLLEPAEAAAPTGDRIDVQAALDRLSVEHRAVLVLHHGLAMPVERVAELLGVPVGTVKSRLSRARTEFAQHYTRGVLAHD